jgi:hypothetical protein
MPDAWVNGVSIPTCTFSTWFVGFMFGGLQCLERLWAPDSNAICLVVAYLDVRLVECCCKRVGTLYTKRWASTAVHKRSIIALGFFPDNLLAEKSSQGKFAREPGHVSVGLAESVGVLSAHCPPESLGCRPYGPHLQHPLKLIE